MTWYFRSYDQEGISNKKIFQVLQVPLKKRKKKNENENNTRTSENLI